MNPIRNRRLYPISFHSGKFVSFKNGKKLLNLASNDYLGLSNSDLYRQALRQFSLPVGSGASRLLSGNDEFMLSVEERWARYRGFDLARFFPSGYQLNVSLIPALMGSADLVLLDRLVHASIIDGVKMAGVRFKRYRHNDLGHLERLLEENAGKKVWVITETVFSMEGDFAPISEIVSLAKRWGAKVYVDEAHSVGVWGIEGISDVDVLIGTFGKAVGLWGAYVCMDKELEWQLLNMCRGFIFSTAPSPLLFYLVEFFLDSILPTLNLDDYKSNIGKFRSSLGEIVGENLLGASQIVPIVLGTDEKAVRFYELSLERGLFCPPIRPPTVPEGTSRVRLSVRRDMDWSDLARVVDLVSEVFGR